MQPIRKLFAAPARLARAGAGDEVYRQVRAAIEAGRLTAGERLAGAMSLHKQFHASYHAALKAFDRLESEGWIVRRRGSGTYVCDASLQVPRTHPKKVLLLRRDCSRWPAYEQFFRVLVGSVQNEVESRGSIVSDMVMPSSSFDKPPDRLKGDAVVWVSPNPPREWALPAKPPFVIVGQDCEWYSARASGYDVVTCDERQGGALAGKHLRAIGCKRVIFLGVGDAAADGRWETHSRVRLDGFAAGWGAPLAEADVFRAESYMSVSGAEAAARILRKNGSVDGVFAASDELAMGFCHGALAHGVRMGADLKLVGFDGQPAYFPGDPPLTTVAAPMEQMGRSAARMALERAENPGLPSRRLMMGCSLRKGKTA